MISKRARHGARSPRGGKTFRTVVTYIAAVLLVLSAMPLLTTGASADAGVVRLWIGSGCEGTSANLRIDGSFSAQGFDNVSFTQGTYYNFQIVGGRIQVPERGWDFGAQVTLKRHDAPYPNRILYRHPGYDMNIGYYGDMTLSIVDGKIRMICTMDIEEYLLGVVLHEMPASWPIEALKAQAISARTYAMRMRMQRAATTFYDVRDTDQDQVYKGQDALAANANQAVRDTAGVVIRYQGQLAQTFYSSTSGGATETASAGFASGTNLPYLIIQPDEFDWNTTDNGMHRKVFKLAKSAQDTGEWATTKIDVGVKNTAGAFETSVFEAFLIARVRNQLTPPATGWVLDEARGISLRATKAITLHTPRNQYHTNPDRGFTKADITFDGVAAWVNAQDTQQKTDQPFSGLKITVAVDELKAAFGYGALNYRMLVLTEEAGVYYLHMARTGHGVGMSQYGARARAQANHTHQQILGFYYPGTVLDTVDTGQPPQIPEEAEPDNKPVLRIQVSNLLNLRVAPNSGSEVIAQIPKDTLVEELERLGDWTKVRYGQYVGYCSSTYLDAYALPQFAGSFEFTPLGTYTMTGLSSAALNTGTVYTLAPSGGQLRITGGGLDALVGEQVLLTRRYVDSTVKFYDPNLKIDVRFPGHLLLTLSGDAIIAGDGDGLPTYIRGDVNGDGSITITDILYIRAHILDTYVLSAQQFLAADVNKDGVVNITDILYIRAHILGTYNLQGE